MQPRNGGQEGAIGAEVLTGEAGQEMEIRWGSRTQSLREASRHLCQISLIPRRLVTIERWHDEHLERI